MSLRGDVMKSLQHPGLPLDKDAVTPVVHEEKPSAQTAFGTPTGDNPTPGEGIKAVPGSRAQGWRSQGRSEVLARNGVVATSDPLYASAIHFCHGFVSGAWQYHNSEESGPKGHRLVCPPDPPPTRNDAIAMFVAWSATHRPMPKRREVSRPQDRNRVLQVSRPEVSDWNRDYPWAAAGAAPESACAGQHCQRPVYRLKFRSPGFD